MHLQNNGEQYHSHSLVTHKLRDEKNQNIMKKLLSFHRKV